MYTRQKASELRNEIVTLREENPNMTLREIGEIVNRTRERVRQILTSEDAETRSAKRIESDNRPDPICRVCNKSFSDINIPKSKSKIRVYCRECINNGSWAIDMGERRRRILRINVPCAYCGIEINMRETLYKRQQSKHTNLF